MLERLMKSCECRERPKFKPARDFKLINNYSPDIVAVDRKTGQLYIVECKAGKISRPTAGLGKLLLYRRLIRNSYRFFKTQLEERFGEIANSVRKNEATYMLVLSEGNDQARKEFLHELVDGIRDPKIDLRFV